MENPQEFRAFWSVIPATVLDDMQLPANAKILYGFLSSLMQREGYCWPSNAQLAEAMHCSEDVITRWIAALGKAGHIKIMVEPNRKTGGKIRRIFPSLPEPVLQENAGGYSDKYPSTYSDKNPRVVGQKSESLYIDGKKKEKKKRNIKEMAAGASLLERCEPLGFEVVSAMQSFLMMRAELKKPIQSERSATMLWNKLQSLSAGDAACMARMLNNSTEHQWLSVYRLKDDEYPQPPKREVDTGGVRFL